MSEGYMALEKIYEKSETGCCPRFNPAPWQDKEIKWKDKLFLKDTMRTFFHIPIGFGKLMTKKMENIIKADALIKEPLMFTEDISAFKTNFYIAVSKEIPGEKMERISGIFLTKVFEGSFKNCGKWAKEMGEYVKSKGKVAKNIYFFYTTCPHCAKVYGKNYVVILARI
jgi:hypothetical protein